MKRAVRAAFRDQARCFGGCFRPHATGILSVLAKGPENVTTLYKALGLKQPTVSHHLGLLHMGRLVVGTRKGKAVVYSTDKANLKALASALGKMMPR
jgi:DNA-binding transcriptional ArsR family regulator